MADTRTRAEKLAAMAHQTVSPREAEVARGMLRRLGVTDAPPVIRYGDLMALTAAFDAWFMREFARGFAGSSEPIEEPPMGWRDLFRKHAPAGLLEAPDG